MEKMFKNVNGLHVEMTEQEIQDFLDDQKKYEEEEAPIRYKSQRQKEYPAIQDQLDMIFWDKINNTNNWMDTIGNIKKKYPNPNNPVELNTDPKNQNNSSWKFW